MTAEDRANLQHFVMKSVAAEEDARRLRVENQLLRSLIAEGPDADEIINRRLREAYARGVVADMQ